MDEKHKIALECVEAFARSVRARVDYLIEEVILDCLTEEQRHAFQQVEGIRSSLSALVPIVDAQLARAILDLQQASERAHCAVHRMKDYLSYEHD